MIYEIFCKENRGYIEIYEKGLKKQANIKIQSLVSNLNSLSSDDVNYTLSRFLNEFLDGSVWDDLKERGNHIEGDIPYPLKNYIKKWIIPRCEDKKMPELRWYYELYHKYSRDVEAYEYSMKCLENAYLSTACDQKTVDMLFEKHLDILGWGAHHFPDGCIITDTTKEDSIKKCEEILREKKVSEHLLQQLEYYKTLYVCYEKYVEDGRTREFEFYLDDANSDFPRNSSHVGKW